MDKPEQKTQTIQYYDYNAVDQYLGITQPEWLKVNDDLWQYMCDILLQDCQHLEVDVVAAKTGYSAKKYSGLKCALDILTEEFDPDQDGNITFWIVT